MVMIPNDLGNNFKCYKITDISVWLICFSVLLNVILCTVKEHLLNRVILEISVVVQKTVQDNGPVNHLAITKSLEEKVM